MPDPATPSPMAPSVGLAEASSTVLLLVRHAETTDNASLRLAGWTDTDLSPTGELQVTLLAEHFNRAHADIAALYASPLLRARRTAEAIAALTGHALGYVDDLREMHFGELEGLSVDEVQEVWGGLLEADEDEDDDDFAWPNGESRIGFTARVVQAMDALCMAHASQTIGVVTHGGVISTLLTVLHGESPARWRKWVVPNASLTEVVWDPRARRGALLRHGDATHLAELTASEVGHAA